MEKEKQKKNHRFSLVERQLLKMEGVKEIMTFDDRSITMETLLGPLVIKGKELNIKAVDLEEGYLQLEGFMNSLEYVSKGKGKGFWARFLK